MSTILLKLSCLRNITLTIALAETSTTSASAPLERKYDLSDSFRGLKPNRHIVAKTGLSDKHFATTQIAWSPDGCWMVAVGDHGMMCIFHRDKSVV